MSAFSVLPYTEEQQERWDRFVMEQSANGTFLQTRRFLNYHPTGRFRDDSRMIFHKQELVAVCPAADGLIDGGGPSAPTRAAPSAGWWWPRPCSGPPSWWSWSPP